MNKTCRTCKNNELISNDHLTKGCEEMADCILSGNRANWQLHKYYVSNSFCQCVKPAYNYPEMLWCDKCGKEIYTRLANDC